MLDLILAVGLAVTVSAACSLAEAALYSLPWSFIEQLRKKGLPSGLTLFALRSNIEKPISAILALNTTAQTVGATIAGAAATRIFGSESMGVFAALFTLVILVFSELLPKVIGVAYARELAPRMARPLRVLVAFFSPILWALGFMTKLVRSKGGVPLSTEDDIRAVVSLTLQSGHIQPYEESAIRNILSLDRKMVKNIMTPRTVIFSLPAEQTVIEARDNKGLWRHSRIPVYDHDDSEDIVGIVFRRDVLMALADDHDEMRIVDLMRPVHFVAETLTLDRLLPKFLESRLHLFVVLDEYGGVAGVVSLEDVLEEMLGKEIVDETDEVEDLRLLARNKRAQVVKTK